MRANVVAQRLIVRVIVGLKSKGCTDCIRRASELCDESIAPYLVGDAVVLVDSRREPLKSILNPFMSNALI